MILALDIATQTGWARGLPGKLEATGTIRLKASGHGWYGMEFFRALHGVILDGGVTAGFYEMPIINHRKVNQTSLATARKLYSLATIAEMVGVQIGGIEFKEIRASTARKHFLGSAKGTREELKAKAMAECIRRGYSPANDDEADAIAIWHTVTDNM